MKSGSRTDMIGRSRGFTLIELMIAVAVVAILAAIAFPSYQDAVRKGRRGEAKADLVENAQVLERYRTANTTYVGVPGFPKNSPATGTAYYRITVGNTGTNTFTLTATPLSDQLKDKCGVLTINQAGARFHEKGTDADCKFGATGP